MQNRNPNDEFNRTLEMIKLDRKIKNATLLTIASCGLFAPVTLPYRAHQKSKLKKLREESQRAPSYNF